MFTIQSHKQIIGMQHDSIDNNEQALNAENGMNFLKDVKQITLKVTNRKQVYHNIHQQKREGPPNKKELYKEGTIESKLPTRKEDTSLKNEDNLKNKATPAKTKLVEKGKQTNIPLAPNEYHLVSHSQRDKIIKGNIGAPTMNEGVLRDSHRRQKIKSAYESSSNHLAEISENLQNIKRDQNNASNYNRRSYQASPSYIEPMIKSSIQK